MKKELRELVERLSTEEYRTAAELSESMGISQKTVRTRLRELDNEGKSYGVRVNSKSRYGYILSEEKEGNIDRFIEETKESFPDTVETRTDYLLVYLLNHNSYIKIETLCDFLCVSRSSLQASIRKTEEILNRYNICLERKPNYGICVQGQEFDIRRCIGECFFRRNMLSIGGQIYSEKEITTLAGIVFELTEKYRIVLSANAFEELITQIYVSIKRIKKGCMIEFNQEYDLFKCQTEWKMATELSERIGAWQKISYTSNEIRYIVIYLAGNRIVGGADDEKGNFIIREEMDRLVVEMLDEIYEDFRIELRDNFNLRMALNQHMVPFDIRMRYQIRINNPILNEIKQNYIFGYTLAKSGMVILERYYGCAVPEGEIAYFAMFFVYALEQRTKEIEKTSILIVCSAGRASSRLLELKYRQEFGKYLDRIYVCGLHELDKFDFNKVEYVFTTVPVHMKVPRPISEVGQFLNSSDVTKVRKILQRGQVDFLDEYYREEQFFTGISGETKEEVIRNICDRIRRQRDLPDGFYEAVLKREELAQTDFGNMIAMPHPYKAITEETFVYVAVLENEIIWSKYPVRLVFLTAVSAAEDKNLPKFYEVTTALFLKEDMVRRIIDGNSFDILMQMLRQIYYTD